jgi:hypothetical protein
MFLYLTCPGMEASLESRADPSQGGGAAGVHRQTLYGEHGSGKRAKKVRGMMEEEKKRLEEGTENKGDTSEERGS